MIRLKISGSYKRTSDFLSRLLRQEYLETMHRYGQIGADALSKQTPRETGRTAGSWDYEIKRMRGKTVIYWTNSNVNDGVNIALILQYGHGTGTGGYIQGYDYINPAIRPVFDQMTDDLWKKVTNG